jgi:hypothetical protein
LPAHLACASMASSWKYIFPFGSHLSSWSLLSRLSVKWAWAVSFVFLPRRLTVAASTRCLRPPRAARPPTSRCQARSSLHALTSPLTPHQVAPPSMALRLLPPAVSPSSALVPLPDHYKRVRSTPRPSPHSPRPQLLASESETFTPPSASSADCSPPSPDRV